DVLNELPGVSLTVICGTGRTRMGDVYSSGATGYRSIPINASKSTFGRSFAVMKTLSSQFDQFDWVMIPAEKKNLPLFLFGLWLRARNRCTKLFSYNHPGIKSRKGGQRYLDRLATAFYYRALDRVVFYTEQSSHSA